MGYSVTQVSSWTIYPMEAGGKLQNAENVPMANKLQIFTADLVLVILYRQQSNERNPTPFNSTHRINVNEWKLFTWMCRTKINLNMPYVDTLVNSEDI
jgi:hypothetical protein